MSSTQESQQQNRKRISVIDSKFSEYKDKLNDGRRFLIAEGVLDKVCRSEIQPKMFFLFDDILVYASNGYDMAFPSYRNRHVFWLKDVKVEDFPETDSTDTFMKHGWNILTPNKSFAVYAPDFETKKHWIEKINKYIKLQTTKEIRPTVYAPVWTADYEITKCQGCKIKFSIIIRKHHCRKCGKIFCHSCSDCKVILENIGQKSVRVCIKCCEKGKYKSSSVNENECDATPDNSDVE